MDERRFIIVKEKSDRMMTTVEVVIDLFTGVQYLFVSEGSSGGLTVLVGPDGKPLIADLEQNG